MKSELTVAVVAPSSPARVESYEAGITELAERFSRVKLYCGPAVTNAGSESGFTCGSRVERVAAIYDAFADVEVDAVICLRGGTGASELLPLFDFRRLSRTPKPFIGFSDVTALLLSFNALAGIPTIHGPHVAFEFARAKDSALANESVEALQTFLGTYCSGTDSTIVLRGKNARDLLPADSELRYQSAVIGQLAAPVFAPVVPANLTMLLSLLGTPWEPDLNGVLLLLEEVNEAPYRIYRMLTQLLLAGKLDSLCALAFGGLSLTEAAPREDGAPHDEESLMRRLAEDMFTVFDFPVLYSMPIGHELLNYPVPVRALGRIEGSNIVLTCPSLAKVEK
ncbi:MAG: LD-carboxypeptidase [bacterium]|nr:LD-carboxypeptidase [bacterium]